MTASYSADGRDWKAISGTRSWTGINEPRIGLFGMANNARALPITAEFDYFLLTPDDTATECGVDETAPTLEVTTDPASPNGDNGWWTGPVTVAATAEDESPGDVSVEFKIGEAAWAADDGSVGVAADGTHELRIRATGSDAERAVEALAALIESGFGEP